MSMHVFLWKILVRDVKLVCNSNHNQLCLLQAISSYTRSFSSLSAVKDGKQYFTVSYLMNTYGFTLEKAIRVSKKVHFETPGKPDSIFNLFQNRGFTNAQITRIITIRPKFLVANPEKNFLPKFEFLSSIGLSANTVQQIICGIPSILTHSLENHMIPSYKFIKSIIHTDEKVEIALKSCPKILCQNVQKRIAPNISTLRSIGVPESAISYLLTHGGQALLENCENFDKYVKEVLELGFATSTLSFVVALRMISKTSESTWNHKMEVLKKWGWSETQFRSSFRSNPSIMSLSEEKISSVIQFIVTNMGFESSDIARNPSVLACSLEKRIIPRCAVMKILISKGLIKKDLGLSSYLLPNETIFLRKFVIKYEKEYPELLSVYQGNMR